jgi:putative oxidoreductase
MIAIARIRGALQPVVKGLDTLAPLLDLGIRLYVANVFFKSGLNKFQSWDSTLALFEHEYQVPLLSPELAAWLGTATELTFPVLLALGIAGRFSALVLFAFNIIAVVSYPDLNEAGMKDHLYWGILLAVTALHGPGRLSLDHVLGRVWKR